MLYGTSFSAAKGGPRGLFWQGFGVFVDARGGRAVHCMVGTQSQFRVDLCRFWLAAWLSLLEPCPESGLGLVTAVAAPTCRSLGVHSPLLWREAVLGVRPPVAHPCLWQSPQDYRRAAMGLRYGSPCRSSWRLSSREFLLFACSSPPKFFSLM